MNCTNTSPLITSKSHIEQAIELYKKLLYFDFSIYQEVVYHCLTKYFNVNNSQDIKILKAVSLKSSYSSYIQWEEQCYTQSVTKIATLIKSLDKKPDTHEENKYYKSLSEILDKKDIKSIGETYRNQLSWLVITKCIITSQPNYTEESPSTPINEWIGKISESDLPNKNVDDFLNKITRICVAYLFYVDSKTIARLLSWIPLKFYYLFTSSALQSEFLFTNNYSQYIKYQNIPELEQYNIYPDIVRTGINKIIECIKTYCLQISQIIEINNDNIIKESVYIQQQYIKSHSDENPNSIKTPYWDHIVDIIVLVFKMSLIDISYVSNNTNIKTLSELINAINQFRNYLDNNQYISKLHNNNDEKIYDRVKDINEIVLFKTAILYEQILNQKQPEDTLAGIPRFEYNVIGGDKISEIIRSCKIKNNNPLSNPFINYCKNRSRILLQNFKDFCQYYKIEGDLVNSYNSYVINGINKNLEYSVIYHSIKNKNDDNFLIQLARIMESIHPRSTPPSLYIKTIKRLCIIVENNIEKKDAIKVEQAIALLNEMINNLRIFTLSYKNQLTTPYRFKPILEHSFYIVNNNNSVESYSIKDFNSLSKNDNVFFVASLEFSPINYTYLENFYYLYNRETHRLNRLKRQLDSEQQTCSIERNINETANKVKEEISADRKSTIQLLGVFGSFIAFVSSIAGMVKSVVNFWQFILFCITFVGCISIFVYLIYYITDRKDDDSKGIDAIILYIILLLWFVGYIIYKNLL